MMGIRRSIFCISRFEIINGQNGVLFLRPCLFFKFIFTTRTLYRIGRVGASITGVERSFGLTELELVKERFIVSIGGRECLARLQGFLFS